jgi:hypothetical protein
MAAKRNKKYQPRGENPNPLNPFLTQVELVGLKRLGQNAIGNFIMGTGTQRHWCDLACRLIVGRKLVMSYFNEHEVAAQIHNNIARLIQLYDVEGKKPNGTWSLTEFDIDCIKANLDVIDDILPQVTRKEYGNIYGPIAKIQINELVSENCTWEEYQEMNAVTK